MTEFLCHNILKIEGVLKLICNKKFYCYLTTENPYKTPSVIFIIRSLILVLSWLFVEVNLSREIHDDSQNDKQSYTSY